MRITLLKVTSSLLFLGSLTAIVSCGDDDNAPDNEIHDADGLEISLTWTTSTGNALDNADLDLYIHDVTGERDASENAVSFETLIMSNAAYADGEYTIKVKLYENTALTNYTLSVTGITVSTTVSGTGAFADADLDGTIVDFFRIEKEGEHYTVIEL